MGRRLKARSMAQIKALEIFAFLPARQRGSGLLLLIIEGSRGQTKWHFSRLVGCAGGDRSPSRTTVILGWDRLAVGEKRQQG